MRDIRSIWIASAALALVSSAALAQQALSGTVTRIDRLNGTISIRETPGGTVGASGGTVAARQYKVPGSSLEALHAGDLVTFSATQSGGVDTITKIEKKK